MVLDRTLRDNRDRQGVCVWSSIFVADGSLIEGRKFRQSNASKLVSHKKEKPVKEFGHSCLILSTSKWAELLTEIMKIEAGRDLHLKSMEGEGILTDIAPEFRERHRAKFDKLDDFTRKIDFLRQKLISLELLMLDNSVKSLQSAMGQVDGSVKSLKTTTEEVLKSSTKLERLTLILVWVTIFVGLTGIFNVSVVYLTINSLVWSIGIIATFAGFTALIAYAIPTIRRLRKS